VGGGRGRKEISYLLFGELQRAARGLVVCIGKSQRGSARSQRPIDESVTTYAVESILDGTLDIGSTPVYDDVDRQGVPYPF
jgi:hypothetical protein